DQTDTLAWMRGMVASIALAARSSGPAGQVDTDRARMCVDAMHAIIPAMDAMDVAGVPRHDRSRHAHRHVARRELAAGQYRRRGWLGDLWHRELWRGWLLVHELDQRVHRASRVDAERLDLAIPRHTDVPSSPSTSREGARSLTIGRSTAP